MKKSNPKLEYAYLLDEFGFTYFEECSEEENRKYAEMLKNGEELPDGITPKLNEYGGTDDTFYSTVVNELSEKEKMLYLQMRKIKLLKTIKNCAVFFVILEILALFGAFVSVAF